MKIAIKKTQDAPKLRPALRLASHCHMEIKVLDKRTFVSYTIAVACLVVKRPFASYRKNRTSYDRLS